MAHRQRRGILDPRQDNGGGGGIIPISIPPATTAPAPPASVDVDDPTTRPPVSTPPADTPATSAPPPPLISISVPLSIPVSAPPPTSTAPEVITTTSSQVQPSRSQVRSVVQSTIGDSIINVTRTSTVDAPSASASAAAQTETEPEKKSGIGKGTLIAIIVVASSCAGVFIIWTVIRRWKLKPTREFERRLQPIDFGPGGEKTAAYEPMPSTTSLNRADSFGSNGSAEKHGIAARRRDSFGSMTGSQRGGGGSVIGSQRGGSQRGGVAQSESGSRIGGTTYPPTHTAWNSYSQQQAPAHQLPYAVPSPPRLNNPYGNSDYGATHGIQRSDTLQSSRYGGPAGDPYGRY